MFDKNRLVGYHASQLTENSACMYSAMTHPAFRKQGIFMKLTTDLHERLALLRDYVYLFSNSMIRPIHIEKEGYTEVYRIKEYRIPKKPSLFGFKTGLEAFDDYQIWRYRNHPLINYIFLNQGEKNEAIFSTYENRVQIVDFNVHVDDAINMGMYIAFAHGKEYVSFWSEIEYDYPSILIPTWKHYKILNPKNIDMDDIMKNDKLRMGMSDVF